MGNAETMRSIALLSKKGGVGRTYCSAGLARAFSRRGKTLLIDFDAEVHTLDILFSVEDRALFALDDLFAGKPAEDVLIRVQPDLYICKAPDGEDCFESKSASSAIFDTARRMGFETVIFDAPARGAGAAFALKHADTALAVSGFDALSVLAAEVTAYEIWQAGKEPKLLFNRFHTDVPHEYKIMEIVDRVHARVYGVQFDYGCFRNNQTQETEDRIFDNVAARLCGESRALFDGTAGEKKLRALLMRS